MDRRGYAVRGDAAVKQELRPTILFMIMSGIAAVLVAVVLLLSCLVLEPGLLLYGVPYGSRMLHAAVYGWIGGNIAIYTATLLCIYTSWCQHNIWQVVCLRYISFLFSFTQGIARFCGQAHRIRYGYIVTRNAVTLRKKQHFMPKDILILAPHCLQWDQCPHKITRTIDNCCQCGHCPVGTILALAQAHGVHFVVATGGTLARQLVRQHHPKLVIAIACERDLISGMQNTAPLPVIGLLNKRPNGPCLNTQVNISALHTLLDTMIGETS